MTIHIPTDIFTVQTLRHTYQPTDHLPINTLKHDSLFARLLVLHFENYKCDVKHLEKSFLNMIDLDVPTAIADKITAAPYRTGLKLKRHARDIFHDYIYARHAQGMQVVVAIRNFCTEHEIALDIDISFDALEKSWKRFFYEKNRDIFDSNRRKAILQTCRKIHNQQRTILPYSDDKLDDLIDRYKNENIQLFLVKRRGHPKMKKKLDVQLRIYVYHRLGGRPMDYCRKKLRLNVTERNLYQYVATFDNFLQFAPQIL